MILTISDLTQFNYIMIFFVHRNNGSNASFVILYLLYSVMSHHDVNVKNIQLKIAENSLILSVKKQSDCTDMH
jgi:hypothetical protein